MTCEKFSLFPSFLADPYEHQHAPMRGLSVANRFKTFVTCKKNQSIPIKPCSPWTASARTHSLTYLSVANSLVCVAPMSHHYVQAHLNILETSGGTFNMFINASYVWKMFSVFSCPLLTSIGKTSACLSTAKLCGTVGNTWWCCWEKARYDDNTLNIFHM